MYMIRKEMHTLKFRIKVEQIVVNEFTGIFFEY